MTWHNKTANSDGVDATSENSRWGTRVEGKELTWDSFTGGGGGFCTGHTPQGKILHGEYSAPPES